MKLRAFRRPLAARIAWVAIATCVAAAGCDSYSSSPGPATTLLFGPSDNAEAIKVIPGQDAFILVSSKARKVTRLRVAGGKLEIAREVTLFPNDPSESETTNLAIAPNGTWAVLTRTIIATDTSGAQTGCGGEAVFIDATDTAAFGTILTQVPVGPMPDSVAVTPSGAHVVVANERDDYDEAWGKCQVATAEASISVIDMSGGPSAPVEIHRIRMINPPGAAGPREPESVAIAEDSDHVAVTLQDTHELALFRISELAGKADPTSDDLQVIRLPDDALGAGPWPDGVLAFTDLSGAEHYAVAGEWNDTFSIVDADGTVRATQTFSPSDLPADLPRVIQAGYPFFEPDSIASFIHKGRVYLGFTLRQAGAVAFYDVSDVTKITYAWAVAVGKDETGGQDEDGSTIRPEGVAATADGRFIVTANEGESSATLIVPAE